MANMYIDNDDYDVNERIHSLKCDNKEGESKCLIVKHIDVNWAISDDLKTFRNLHFLIICQNESTPVKKFDELLRYDHLNVQNIERFPLQCRLITKQEYLTFIIESQQQELRIATTESITGRKWSNYYVGCSEDESLVGLAVNQLREMCFGSSEVCSCCDLNNGVCCSTLDRKICKEGFFNGETLHFIRDRKKFVDCLPKCHEENYQLFQKLLAIDGR